MWIQYEKLSYKNCYLGLVRFVKSPAKRRKAANVYLNTEFWIEAQLHVEKDMALRLRKAQKKWGKTGFDCEKEPWQRTYCGAVHLSVYINDDKMYSKSKNELREFKNPWLFKRITGKAFA